MEYHTTKLQALKQYPTYQFYAQTDPERCKNQLTPSDVFRICILETFRWLRARLGDAETIPPELQLPEPDHYADLAPEALRSFTLNLGWSVEAVYIPEQGIWSFRLHETDMGANLGTPTERLPVQGRTFETEIAFRELADSVECGIRTICSEPIESTADCEVFRPTVVRFLAENPLIGLRCSGVTVNGQAVKISTRAGAEHFAALCQEESFNLPLVLVIDSGYETEQPPKNTQPAAISAGLHLQESFSFGLGSGFSQSFRSSAADITLTADPNAKKPLLHPAKAKKPTAPAKQAEPTPKAQPVKKKRADFPYEHLAAGTMSFAAVFYAEEQVLPILQNKLKIQAAPGDIVVLLHGEEMDHYVYGEYSEDGKALCRKIRKDLNRSTMRRNYSYGTILFCSDAHLSAIRGRRALTDSLEERCELYHQENHALKARLESLVQQDNDLRLQTEALRSAQKKAQTAETELDALKIYCEELNQEFQARQAAYKRDSELTAFYRNKCQIAAGFPTHMQEICDWAEAEFSDTLLIAPRAKSEMRKYNGGLNTGLLCDSLFYLHGYAQFRQGAISEEMLAFYTDTYQWEVSPCGKEALRMRANDYSVQYEGEKYILDMHLKYGNRAANLIRIYFCWVEAQKKLLIGSMPEHLATVRYST